MFTHQENMKNKKVDAAKDSKVEDEETQRSHEYEKAKLAKESTVGDETAHQNLQITQDDGNDVCLGGNESSGKKTSEGPKICVIDEDLDLRPSLLDKSNVGNARDPKAMGEKRTKTFEITGGGTTTEMLPYNVPKRDVKDDTLDEILSDVQLNTMTIGWGRIDFRRDDVTSEDNWSPLEKSTQSLSEDSTSYVHVDMDKIKKVAETEASEDGGQVDIDLKLSDGYQIVDNIDVENKKAIVLIGDSYMTVEKSKLSKDLLDEFNHKMILNFFKKYPNLKMVDKTTSTEVLEKLKKMEPMRLSSLKKKTYKVHYDLFFHLRMKAKLVEKMYPKQVMVYLEIEMENLADKASGKGN